MGEEQAPVGDQWYPLKLGPTCSDDASTRFYALRYEFKPASIDNSRPGSLHSTSDNKVTVEFFNNQVGKPKFAFSGNLADCHELDAMVFFDGESFRLERMHRNVTTLRHVRMPGESLVAPNASLLKETETDSSPPHANGNAERITAHQVADKSLKKPAAPTARSEKIEAEVTPVVTKPDPPGRKKANKKNPEVKPAKGKKGPGVSAISPVGKKREREPSPVHVDIDDEDASPEKKAAGEEEQVEVEEVVEEIEEEVSDYEEVDISEDEDADKTGTDQTAVSLRAQADAGLIETKPSSSSDSSGSGSSESGSGSSESESGSDEEDSASSADDGDDI